MPNNNYYLYVNSKNRQSNEDVNNFSVFLTNQLFIGRNQGLNVSVVGFSMLNSMYNVNSNNNYYQLEERDLNNNLISTTNLYINNGNYNAYSLRDYLNQQLTSKINIDYNSPTNTYKFTNITANKRFYINPINSHKFLGLSNKTEITTAGINGSFINLVNYSQVIIKCPSLDFEDKVQDNINQTKEMGMSSILFMIDKQDVQPFQMIVYKNEDGNNNFNYNIMNRILVSLNFQLYNENNEIIKDASDYFLTLKFTLFERYDDIYKDIGFRSLSLLDDIQFTLLNILFKRDRTLL
jgi:hypothetical protein